MLNFFNKNRSYPIGIDVGDDRVKLVQLDKKEKSTILVAGNSREKPKHIEPGSGEWQRWVIDVVKELTDNGAFVGKDVVASVPPSDVFIDHLKLPKSDKGKIEDALISCVKQKLDFDSEQAALKCITTEDDNVLVMVTEKEKINRHLAVYEQAGLNIKSICVWPVALTKTYVSFFGRRKEDLDAVVLLLEIEPHRCNVVICRHLNLLFAKTIPIGIEKLNDEGSLKKFMLELTGCKRHFNSMYKKAEIERMIFLTSQGGNSAAATGAFAMIAKHMEMPAQIGDCLAAVEMNNGSRGEIDRRGCDFSWATAFGLSLSEED